MYLALENAVSLREFSCVLYREMVLKDGKRKLFLARRIYRDTRVVCPVFKTIGLSAFLNFLQTVNLKSEAKFDPEEFRNNCSVNMFCFSLCYEE